MASNALQLQLDIAAFLDAHSRFQHVPIVCAFRDEAAGDALIDDVIKKSLGGQLPKNGRFGLCVAISFPTAVTTAQDAPGPIENFSLFIQVIEHTGNNKAAQTGTGIRSDDLYEDIKRMLHLHCHDGVHDLIVTRGEQDEEMPRPMRGFIIELESKAHVLEEMKKVSTPQVGVNDPMMSITCATDGAAIYWTHDGSFPSPANPTAQAYTAPVDVGELPGGTLIRAAAYLEGRRGSDCAIAEI